MVSNRERARAAMAALDRRNPNLDDFVGLNWSSWIDRANILASEAGSNVEECSRYGKKLSETMTLREETMTLRKEDMHLYGHCPALDEFYLVVCSHCGQVVKPQAFEKHCERRHGPLTKLCSQSLLSAPQQRPRPGQPPLVLSSSRERQKDSRPQGAGAPSAALALPQHRPAKAQKEAVSLPPVERFPQETPPSPPYSSTPCPRVPPWHSGPLPPGGHPSSSSSTTSSPEKAPLQKPVAGQTDDPHSPPRGPRNYSRTHKKVYKKECDLDKHCGVLDPGRKKLCTRQLMCNIHSIHQRRKVLGRSKTFDQLVMEQRTGSKGRDLERPPACRDAHTAKETLPCPEAPEEPTAPQHSKRSLSSNCAMLRSRESSESCPEEEDGDSTVEPPYPFNQSLLSSQESEGEEQEEARDLPATPWHPKPLGLCTFGSRTLGCSIFTFDRRLHHLRFALSAMVEHHISAHLWKKIPQVSTGLRSHHATTRATGSSIRTGGRASSPSGSSLRSPPPSSLPHRATGRERCSSGPGSTSSGQSDIKSSQHNPPSTKPPSSTLPSAGLGLGRPRNPVGRPSKARLRERELMRATSATDKASKPPRSDVDQSSKRIRDYPLDEKGRPHSPARVCPSPTPSPQGPINGALSRGKKPCPPQLPHPSERHSPSPGAGKLPTFPAPLRPPHPSPRGRGRPPGMHRRLVSYDHRGLAKKRKTSGGSPPPLSPSMSRTPKAHCLASTSHSHSSLLWRGQSMGAPLARGLEKTMDPQRPKLQH